MESAGGGWAPTEFGGGNVQRILSWVGTTIGALALAFVIYRPRACLEDERCSVMHDRGLGNTHLFAITALCTALVMESMSLFLSYKSAQGLVGIVKGLEYTFIPPVLLCCSFLVLIAENLSAHSLVFVHSAVPGVGSLHGGRPIYTTIIIEWLVNVPILMVLSGNCALARPFTEVSRPLVVTNLYIILSWGAYFTPNAAIRWATIGVAFVMYAWASYDMTVWVMKFRAGTRADHPARNLRCALSIGLIIMFFVYGMVYLAGHLDLVTPNQELMWWVVMNLGVKLSFVIAFVGIRASQFFDLLVNLIANKVLPFERQVVAPMDFDDFGDVMEDEDVDHGNNMLLVH